MKIVIFGATGFVGKSTLKEALKRDYQVTIFVRDKSKVTIQHKTSQLYKGMS